MTTTIMLRPVTLEEAPEQSRAALERVQKAFTFILNLFGLLGHSPALLEGYSPTFRGFRQVQPVRRRTGHRAPGSQRRKRM